MDKVKEERCPKVLKANTLASFTVCPVCGLVISNGFEGLLLHPLAQGISHKSLNSKELKEGLLKVDNPPKGGVG